MKFTKLFLALAFSVGVFGLVASKVWAVTLTQVGVVEGVVSGTNEDAVSGANVTVVCHHSGGDQTGNTTTDGDGFYFVQFSNYHCVLGDNVTVTATKGGQTGTQNGVMQDGGTVGRVHLDVSIVNIPMVPEFSLITGGLALLTSAGSLIFLRKRIV